jgi:hypothetical protein
MVKQYKRNSGKPITPVEIKQIKALAIKNTPTGIISLKIGRTPNAIRNIASGNDISLKPTNQSPYNRRKK